VVNFGTYDTTVELQHESQYRALSYSIETLTLFDFVCKSLATIEHRCRNSPA